MRMGNEFAGWWQMSVGLCPPVISWLLMRTEGPRTTIGKQNATITTLWNRYLFVTMPVNCSLSDWR